MAEQTAVDTRRQSTDPSPRQGRVSGLDGIRGIAALFVVVHHCYLVSFPGYPDNTGPMWTAWLLFGHVSVAVFIVVSGFSLAVAPARKEWQLGGRLRFAHRRAWRILPPYWAALLFSLVIAWTVVPQPGEPAPTAGTVVVYGLLLQDITGAPSPNGAFWSIAVEAQLYCVFPLLLLVLRRAGAAVMAGSVTVVVLAIGILAPHVPAVDVLTRLTPQFAVLFALGVVASGILRAGERISRLPWAWFAVASALPVVLTMAVKGSVWWDGHLFWADLALGPAVAMVLVAVTTGRPAPLVASLDSGPIRRLGLFSYSLYLIHAPIVVATHHLLSGHVAAGLPTLGATLGTAVPLSIGAAWLFSLVFELPFQRHRSWSALRQAMSRWWSARTASRVTAG